MDLVWVCGCIIEGQHDLTFMDPELVADGSGPTRFAAIGVAESTDDLPNVRAASHSGAPS